MKADRPISLSVSDREQSPRHCPPYHSKAPQTYKLPNTIHANKCHLVTEEILRFCVIFQLFIIWTGKASFLELQSSALSSMGEQHINEKKYHRLSDDYHTRIIKEHQRPKCCPKENFNVVDRFRQRAQLSSSTLPAKADR